MEDDKIKQFSIAFIKAKQAFKKTGLDGNNTHLKSKYASLVKIYEAVEDALHDNGFYITHRRYREDGKAILVTKIEHTAGHFIEDEAIVESEKPGHQAHGAALTYNKKYAVLGLCAIHADKDDDGEEEQRHIDKKQYNKPIDIKTQYITQDQFNQIELALDGISSEVENIILRGMKVDTWLQLTQDKFMPTLNAISMAKN